MIANNRDLGTGLESADERPIQFVNHAGGPHVSTSLPWSALQFKMPGCVRIASVGHLGLDTDPVHIEHG